jgi:recombinational DNA repair protein (RecF pathway)
METKTCCRCKETKPLTAFNLKPQAACKPCINIYQAEYRDRNRERRNAAAQVRYQKLKDKLLVYSAQYREQHRERLNALQRDYAKREERLVADRALRAKYKEGLTDAYVRRSLVKNTGISVASVPLDLIAVKRLQLQIQRKIQNG